MNYGIQLAHMEGLYIDATIDSVGVFPEDDIQHGMEWLSRKYKWS